MKTNILRKGIAWLLCAVMAFGMIPMLPQMAVHVSAEAVATVKIDGVELQPGSYFKNGDTSTPTGTGEDWNARYDSFSKRLYLNNLQAKQITAEGGNLTIELNNNGIVNTNRVTGDGGTAIAVTGGSLIISNDMESSTTKNVQQNILTVGGGNGGNIGLDADNSIIISGGVRVHVSEGLSNLAVVRAKAGDLTVTDIGTKLEISTNTGYAIKAKNVYLKNSATLTAYGYANALDGRIPVNMNQYGYEDYEMSAGDVAPGTRLEKGTSLTGYRYIQVVPTRIANVKTQEAMQAAAKDYNIKQINVMNDITLTQEMYVRHGMLIRSADAANPSKLIRGVDFTGVMLDVCGSDGHESDTVTLQNITLDGNKSVNTKANSPALQCERITVVLGDGAVIENNYNSGNGGAVFIRKNERHTGTVRMQEGSVIRNNEARQDGTVYVNSTGNFEMTGGTISDNKVGRSGGGICTVSGGSVTVSGGTISGNTAAGNGGGIFVPTGTTCKVSDGVNISDNKKNDAKNNVYLSGAGAQISVCGALSDSAKIGVTSALDSYPVTIGAGSVRYGESGGYVLDMSDVTKFVSDQPGLIIEKDSDELYLVRGLTALNASDFQFEAPQNTVYDGKQKEVKITKKDGTACGAITVEFYQNGVKAAPVNAGTYTVKINVEEDSQYFAATGLTDSSWTFTIQPRSLSVSVADVVISKGSAIPALTVKIDGFAAGENETNVAGFQKPAAAVSGTVNTNDTTVKSFGVTYSGGNATVNYQFVWNTMAKLTIQDTASPTPGNTTQEPTTAAPGNTTQEPTTAAPGNTTQEQATAAPGNTTQEQATAAPDNTTQKKYKVIEGADATYTVHEDGSVTMRANGKYKNFKGVTIDGKTVDSKNYTAWSGSTYVKFKKEFMESLSVGKHTVKFLFADGYAKTSLTIAEKNATKNASETKHASDTKKNTKKTDSKSTDSTQGASPKTGDAFQPMLWAVVLGVYVVTLLGLVVVGHKKRHHEK